LPVVRTVPAHGLPLSRDTRLDRVEVRRLAVPLRRPFQTSRGRTTVKDVLLVLVSADGVTGVGECVADSEPSYLPETTETVIHVLRDFLAPAALAAPLAHPRDLAARFGHVRGHEMAKAALEMAVWELWARREGVPLHRLLGGRGGEVAAGVSIGLQESVEALLEVVAREREAGYRRYKVKIEPGRDVALVEALRRRFPDLPLLVDANGAYGADDTAVFEALDGQGLLMVEQPLGWDDLLGHARLQRRLATALCLDESVRSPHLCWQALELGAARVINIKAGRVGGFAASVAIHDLCRERGVPVWCGGMLETGIGRLANVHLQTLPGFTPGDTSASARMFEEDLVEPPVTVSSDGTIAVPERPGIGHEILWTRVAGATVWQEEWVRA
jgi:O-succinylbenzoate synthase